MYLWPVKVSFRSITYMFMADSDHLRETDSKSIKNKSGIV